MSKHSCFPPKYRETENHKGLYEILAEIDESEEKWHEASVNYLQAAKFLANLNGPMARISYFYSKSKEMAEKAHMFHEMY